jgi:hypothetical protein
MALLSCSCIFAWSSWPSSFWRSDNLFCITIEFWLTAALAWSAAWVDCRSICLSDSTSRSVAMSRLAKASAVWVYSAALAVSPLAAASSAMVTAWRAEPLSFSNSAIDRLSRISVCFWLAMTLAACSTSRRCCSCASVMACSS